MYVSARERKMIEYLIEARDPVPVKKIAEALGVSTRTVHRDLNGLEQTLNDYDLFLQKQTGRGIQLLGEQEGIKKLRGEIHEAPSLDYTPDERKVLILSWLLDAKEPVKLMSLASDLGVTVATASHDLDQIEEDLSAFDLQLVRRRGYGVEVVGKEVNIREALQRIMMQHMSEYDFLKLLKQYMSVQTDPSALDAVTEHLLGLVSKEQIHTIEEVVESYRSELTYPLADSAYIGLIIHLALAMERIKQGEEIQMEPEYLNELRPTKEFDVALQMIRQLEKDLDLVIPEAEIGYITMHLMGAKARYNKDSVIEESSLRIAFKAKQLIEYVSNALQNDLQNSEKLLNDLVVHLKPSLYRIQQGMDIQNPLLQQIEEDYTDLFVIIEDAVKHVFPKLAFPKEETAFLVMHFASALLNLEETKRIRVLVVCSSGIGTAKILAAKLKRQFHEIETVDHQSLFDLRGVSLDQYDLIVSTIPIDHLDHYVLVNPMLSKADIHRIEHRIRKIRIIDSMRRHDGPEQEVKDQTLESVRHSVTAVQQYIQTISHLLNSLYTFQPYENEKEHVIVEVCRKLEEREAIRQPDEVSAKLIERESVGGLGIPDTGIALYHTRSHHIPKPSFSVASLQQPVAVQSMTGETMDASVFVFLLAPESLSGEGLEVVSYLSTLFIEDPASVEVMNKGSEEQMKDYVSNQLHRLMKEKLSS
ncbi:BglG family transcription antiterminator [Halobacillus litoralis]|uniref:BglG family transcription antiterminator n=1 Tax=Halobacillus litoralis TaxID=45668 RepID=UPI001CD2797E|nr:BglG family transcription antiterminator [Halobacillus litoralis]MCA0971893.1 BglG family transcription antiterminator [Halobacillus litoralis]